MWSSGELYEDLMPRFISPEILLYLALVARAFGVKKKKNPNSPGDSNVPIRSRTIGRP